MVTAINFIKPSFKKLALTLFVWAFIWLLSYLLISICYFADCVENGSMTSCCSSLENDLAGFLIKTRETFPVVAYLLSCLLIKK